MTSRLALKTLIVSYSMPPALNGSTFVVRNLAAQFPNDEILVAGEMWRKSRARGTESPPANFHYVWKQPNINSVRLVNWARHLWLPIILWRLIRLVRREQVQMIVGIYPNEFYLRLAWWLSRLTGKPFAAYFHNTLVENREGRAKNRAQRLQRRVFRDAQVVFTMSDGMRDFLKPIYPDVHFVPLVHSHELPEQFENYNGTTVHQPLRIAFVGNANHSNWEAFERFWQAVKNEPCELTVLSAAPPEKFARHGIEGNNLKFKLVPFREELDELRKHDVMFLPHGFTGGYSQAEYKTIFPTKTIPYLISGRPILAHSPTESFLTRWLNENRCALVVDEKDENQIRAAVRELAENGRLRKELVENGNRAVQVFGAERVAGIFRDSINSVVK